MPRLSTLTVILVVAAAMLAVALLAVLAWAGYATYLNWIERRLARRKGLYRDLVASLAVRERELLDPELQRRRTLYDLEALEAVLEEQARSTAERPAWLLDTYDHLGLIDKYITRLRNARRWRERAFAAELLGRVGNARAVPELLETVQATRTEDADVREIALRALARIADPRAVEPLIAALQSAEAWLAPRIADILARHGELVVDPLIGLLRRSDRHPARPWAANVLGELRAQRAFPALTRGLDDPDDEVRAKSATALGRLGDPRALGYLLDHVLSDPAPFVRSRIAAALGQFDDPVVTDRLIRALGDPAWWVRMRSVEALEHIGLHAEGLLLLALEDPDPEIRSRAAIALERLGLPESLVALIQSGERIPETMDTMVKLAGAGSRALLADLLGTPSPDVRSVVVTAIRRARRTDLTPELIQVATLDPSPSLRVLAWETLRALRARASVTAALNSLGDQDDRVRASAISLIGDLGSQEMGLPLRARTADPEPRVRSAAARALGRLGAASASAELLTLLRDQDAGVREAAVRSLGDARVGELVERLPGLLQDEEEGVRLAAVEAAATLRDAAAVHHLTRAMADGSPPLRAAILSSVSRLEPRAVLAFAESLLETGDRASSLGAVAALGRLRSPDAIAILQRVRHHPDPLVRAAVLRHLSRAGGDPAAPLAEGLHDPDERVRAAAADGCARCGCQDQGDALIRLLEADPSPGVRERAALALGLLRVSAGEAALTAVSQGPEPVGVRAAAVLALGAFERDSVLARIIQMADQAAVRQRLRERLREDPATRLLGMRLSPALRLELRALGALDPAQAGAVLASGARTILSAGERIRLISGLRALQGEQSLGALLEMARGDPSPEVRTAALLAAGDLLQGDQLLQAAGRALKDPSSLVRRAGVRLLNHRPAEQALPILIRNLSPSEDLGVMAAAAEVAQSAFPTFLDLASGVSPEGQEALLLARMAQHIKHPDLPQLLSLLLRSPAPEVREAVVAVWSRRPEIVDRRALEELSMDPAVGVRRSAAGAAVAAQQWELLDRMLEDPDPEVRKAVALVLAGAQRIGARGQASLQRLASDADMPVRAAAYVGRLLQGVPVPLPPGLDLRVAAETVRAAADVDALREAARTARAEDRRLAAALALALLHDEVAREVARVDPVPAIRHRVSGTLELFERRAGGERGTA
jgi:HEAT repeat protein